MLKLDGVAAFYGRKRIFRGVSLSVAPGAVCLVAGPNGAGKSTLLKLMAGLARPEAGTVEVRAENPAYIGHETFLYPDLTGLQNLRFWARYYGLAAADSDLEASLERVGLAHAAHEKARTYSRGMAQRCNLARVLVQAPDLLLLDEPGAGLDLAAMAMLRREISAAKERGAGVVWVSHQVADDKALADTVLELSGKTVAYLGPAADYVPEAAC